MQVKVQHVTLLREDAHLTCIPKGECQENENKKEKTSQKTPKTTKKYFLFNSHLF